MSKHLNIKNETNTFPNKMNPFLPHGEVAQ